MKILIVDDDFISCKKLEAIMQNIGQCDCAKSGEEALWLFKAAYDFNMPYDVVLLDVTMPKVNGINVLTQIRNIEAMHKDKFNNHNVKVIMVTANNHKEIVVECVKSGCDDYIVKPISKQTIFDRLLKLNIIQTQN